MTTPRFRRRTLLACCTVAGLVLSACGSDDDDADSTTAATATTAASTTPASSAPETSAASETSAATETSGAASSAPAETTTPPTESGAAADKSPVVIAALIDQTGPSAGDGPSAAKVVAAWAEHINSEGGINGHPVTMDVLDTKGDAAAAQAAIESEMGKNPIAFVLSTSSTESAMAESLAATNVPVIGVGYNPAVWGGSIFAFGLECSTDPGAPVSCAIPNAFTTSTTFGAVVDEQVLGAQAAGATKLAVAACAEVDSCSQAEPIFAADAKALGLEYIGVSKVSSTAADYTAECITYVQEGVDFVQISAASNVGAKMWADCQDQGYTGIFGASAGSVSGDLIKVDGVKLAGGIHGFPWWVDDAPVQEYREVMEAQGLSADEYSSPTSTGLYASLQLFAKANADLPDDPTAADALAAMYTIKGETLDGLLPPVTFTEGERAPARPCFWPYTLEDGVFTNPLGGLKYQCYPPES